MFRFARKLSVTSIMLMQCLLLGFVITPAAAQSLSTKVYFANGIFTREAAANDTVLTLEKNYKITLENLRQEDFPNETYIFDLLYNPTQCDGNIPFTDQPACATDIAQVLEQKAQENGISLGSFSGDDLLSWVELGWNEEELAVFLDQAMSSGQSTPSVSNSELLSFISSVLIDEVPAALAEIQEVELRFKDTLLNDLNAGYRVIIIAHSQGNLFIDAVVNSIRAEFPALGASIGVLGVASPSSEDRRSGEYWTAEDDRIIDALRDRIGNVADGNINNDPRSISPPPGFDEPPRDFREPLKHIFSTSYFEDFDREGGLLLVLGSGFPIYQPSEIYRLPSRIEIDADLEELANSLPYPENISDNVRYLSFP